MKWPASGGWARRTAKILVAAVMLLSVAAAFFGVRECAVAAKIQLVPAVLAANAGALAVLAVLLAVWGRLYCEIVCPLGIVQDLFRWLARKKVRRVCSRLPETRRQLAVRWTVFALFIAIGAAGAAGVAGCSFAWLDPYAIFGRGLALSGILLLVVLALSFFGRGRFWCNWVCPAGTLLQLVSRFAVFKDKVDKCDHCEEFRKCFKK